MTKTILQGKPHAGSSDVWFEEGRVASAKPRRWAPLNKKVVLTLVFAMTACTVLARMLAQGQTEKSYFIDTRCPVVGMSEPVEIETTHSGAVIIIR